MLTKLFTADHNQFSVCTPGGCELAVQIVEQMLAMEEDIDYVVLKLDFANAFNSMFREHILQCLYDRLP